MGLTNILLKDFETKSYYLMTHLNDERVALISSNINEMKTALMKVEVQEFDLSYNSGYESAINLLVSQGWTLDDALYDRLQLKYTEKTNKHLTRWV